MDQVVFFPMNVVTCIFFTRNRFLNYFFHFFASCEPLILQFVIKSGEDWTTQVKEEVLTMEMRGGRWINRKVGGRGTVGKRGKKGET